LNEGLTAKASEKGDIAFCDVALRPGASEGKIETISNSELFIVTPLANSYREGGWGILE
jgi:hypothetical protein